MKKISMVLSVVVVIVALFATTEVMAADPCTLFSCNQISGPSIVQVADGSGRYRWNYTFTGTLTPSTQFYILAPVCTPATGYSVDTGGLVLAPGVGDSTTGFGVGDTSNVVIRLAYQSPYFYFYTDKLVPTRNTTVDGQPLMEFKCGRTYSKCMVQGPACPGISEVIPTAGCKTVLGSVYLSITTDPSTLCPSEIKRCADADCTHCLETDCTGCGVLEPGDHVVDGLTIKGCTTPDGGQTCAECLIIGTGSNCVYIPTGGGKTVKTCYP